MIPSIHPRIRIGIVIIGAFLISGLLMKYTSSDAEISAPAIQIKTMVSDFSQSIANSGSSLLASIQSFKLPRFTNISPQIPEASPTPEQVPPPGGWITNSPPEPGIPTSTPTQLLPTIGAPTNPPYGNPTTNPNNPTSKPNPTKPPQPTKKPKPTAIPKIPPYTDDKRPGSSLTEIFKEVERRVCVPAALLMAFKSIETGERFKTESKDVIEKYNVYGWWKTASLSDTCFGYGYYFQTGLAADDSPYAGQKCMGSAGDQSFNLKEMGVLSVSEWEQETTRKNTVETLSKNIDRRVLFDSAVIFAWAARGRAGKSPQPSCSDWPQETVNAVAISFVSGGTTCKYNYGDGTSLDYCKKVWDLYKSFK